MKKGKKINYPLFIVIIIFTIGAYYWMSDSIFPQMLSNDRSLCGLFLPVMQGLWLLFWFCFMLKIVENTSELKN